MVSTKNLSILLLIIGSASSASAWGSQAPNKNVGGGVRTSSSTSSSSRTAMFHHDRLLQETDSGDPDSGDPDSGDPDSGDPDSDDVNEPTKRECELTQDADEVQWKCKSETENEENDTEIEDEIDFKIKKKDDTLKVKVEYEQEIETADTETESETQYDIVFERIVEYEKADGATSQAFDWENDTVVQTMELRDWGPFSDVVDVGTTSTFSVSTMDGIAKFTFHISRSSEGESISANKMKIDFELLNFPWAQDNTYVALISDVESESEIEIEETDDDGNTSRNAADVIISFDDAVSTIGFVPFGEFTWADTAVILANSTESNATDTTIEVIGTAPSDPTNTSLAFSFVGDAARQAADIYWDPEAGIEYRMSSSASARSVIVSVCVLVASLFVTKF